MEMQRLRTNINDFLRRKVLRPYERLVAQLYVSGFRVNDLKVLVYFSKVLSESVNDVVFKEAEPVDTQHGDMVNLRIQC